MLQKLSICAYFLTQGSQANFSNDLHAFDFSDLGLEKFKNNDTIPDFTHKIKDLDDRRKKGELQNSDAFKSIDKLAIENGFAIESYFVVSDDGYILNIWRIPGFLDEEGNFGGKPPVLLAHGMESDMMQWVMNEQSVAPAFVLARKGYDVWMGNNRGNIFSQNHVSLDKQEKEYWDFSWEEMGTQDTPTMIDFILEKTGFEQISFVGHSEGATQIMAGAALLPEYYKDKIKVCVLLAPPSTMKNNKIMGFSLMSKKTTRKLLESVLDTYSIWNLIPYDFVNQNKQIKICDLLDGLFCNILMANFANTDPTTDFMDRTDVYISYMPSGSGYKNFIHYAQNMNEESDEQSFKRYDYDSEEKNLEKYGQDTPPEYDLSLLDFPIAILSGEKDIQAAPDDVEWAYQQMKNTTFFYEQYYLGHMSFAIAKDMGWFSIDTMAILNHYNNICDESTLESKFEEGNLKCQLQFAVNDEENQKFLSK